ncbi:hypothetical protein CTAM01_05767 [Colletotrichum tamarilloi]|uniref:Secreted protein n=1 Tax=Colletotrichum tamarilloi TaxID=1209934 RepID=A0ABQ9RDE2_9PEZI|nr:uncharacterized protein CTAM01_05767 [Colletotrichum tamarilloi]KAK1501543.1 hypothetical protein CTAM01_05767 [Colletotrichum tamarilloi]
MLWSSGILFRWTTHEILNWTLCSDVVITCLIGSTYEQYHTVMTSDAKETNNTHKDRVKHLFKFLRALPRTAEHIFPTFQRGETCPTGIITIEIQYPRPIPHQKGHI